MDLNIADVNAGDVLLCYSNDTAKERTAGWTGYSHVAIALQGQHVLEASSGVEIVTVGKLLDVYDHIAVLRELNSKEIWSDERLRCLEEFASDSDGKGFNQWGLLRFLSRKERNQENIMIRIQGYFDGTTQPVSTNRGIYFCSELITAAFIRVGIIDQSAAVIFTPETFSPSDIAVDKAFGFFCGYLKRPSAPAISKDDFFKHNL